MSYDRFQEPEMQRLFQGPSLLRRNFIDRIVYSFDSSFLHLINNYTKYIRERSFIIRGQVYDQNWLNNIEKDIAKLGIEITRKRNESLNILNMMINKISSKIKLSFIFSIMTSNASLLLMSNINSVITTHRSEKISIFTSN